MSLGDDIAAAYNVLQDEPEQRDVCAACGGDGWYVGHDDECYDTGDCVCPGVQVRCECQEAQDKIERLEAQLREEHVELHRPAGKLTIRRESCPACAVLDVLDSFRAAAGDLDYAPKYQDEYARLWHEARAEVERLRAALSAHHGTPDYVPGDVCPICALAASGGEE